MTKNNGDKSMLRRWRETLPERDVITGFFDWIESRGYKIDIRLGSFGTPLETLDGQLLNSLLDNYLGVDRERLNAERDKILQE